MPLQRRLPKRGFRRLQANAVDRAEFAVVNLSRLSVFAEGDKIDPETLAAKGLVRPGLKVKILGDGELKVKASISAHAFSKSARDKIAAGGGTVEVIGGAPAK